jgi:hypothetical protein
MAVNVLAELPAKKGNAKVVYPCKPKNDDELKVEVGQVSDVLKQVQLFNMITLINWLLCLRQLVIFL